MNKKNIFSASLLLILFLAMIGQAFCQVQLGVRQGNSFTYDVTYFWSSTDSSAAPPANWIEANTTESLKANVQSVLDTWVTIETIQHFQNGNETTGSELADVATGAGGSILVYAAGLDEGDRLYPQSTSLPWTINETVSRSYSSGPRDTNHIEVRMTDLEDYVYRYSSLYFDKATGIMVEAYLEDVMTSIPDQTFARTIVIKESNVWVVSGSAQNNDGNGATQNSWPPIELVYGIVVVVVVVAVVATVLLVRKRKKKVKQ